MPYGNGVTIPVFGLRREIDRLFEDAFGRGHVGQSEWTPAVNIRETDQELTFAVELPGVELKDVEVTAEDGVLTIQGERTEEWKEGEEGRYYLAECNYGSFMRRFQLPQGVDSEKIEADLELGMLQVSIPKAALPKPKQIQISAGGNGSSRPRQATAGSTSRDNSPKPAVGTNRSK